MRSGAFGFCAFYKLLIYKVICKVRAPQWRHALCVSRYYSIVCVLRCSGGLEAPAEGQEGFPV